MNPNYKEGKMKVLAWNIRQGGGSRIDKIICSIQGKQPDVVVLTEFRNNRNGEVVKAELKKNGLIYQTSGDAAEKNTLFIASRFSFSPSTFMAELGSEAHRCVGVNFDDFHLFGFYFPQKFEKIPIFNFILKNLSSYLNKPTLLIGDFNTGKHCVDEAGATFKAAEYFELLPHKGWVDAWRQHHGNKREYTWYSNQGNGFRIDHAFASPSMSTNVSSCIYSHSERESGVSDHSSLLVEIENRPFVVNKSVPESKNPNSNNSLTQDAEKIVNVTQVGSAAQAVTSLAPPKSIKNDENYLKWRATANRNGSLPLFDYFIAKAGELRGVEIRAHGSKSITLNISGKPVFKIFPSKGRADLGVWLGYKDDNLLQATGKEMSLKLVPKNFTRKSEGWDEGYVSNKEDIDRLLSGIS